MAKPWRKKWPHVGKSGRKSYQLGFRDHDGIVRSKAFPSAKTATAWAEDYVTAERRGRDSLRRFLLDLDAREANGEADAQTIGRVIQLYFAFNAPDTADGLATSTFRTYRHSANRHLLGLPGLEKGKPTPPAEYAVRFAAEPASRFNDPAAPRALREAMRHAMVGPSARAHAWRVLSAVLSWAAASELVPEIDRNGCLLAGEKLTNRRKSMRNGNGRAGARRRGDEIRSWALSPLAVELIRTELLSGADARANPLLAQRDATIVSIQFGLALRNQEVYGLRWSSLAEHGRAQITQVLSWNELDDWAKTEHATGRRTKIPALLAEDLKAWQTILSEYGREPRDDDFLIAGDLTGPGHGVPSRGAGSRHMSGNQAKKWGPRYMAPAVTAVAERYPTFAAIRGATPYALRRGGISARLRGEDPQSVADQCGTSLEMLSQYYSYEIDDFHDFGARSLDEQWRAVRQAART